MKELILDKLKKMEELDQRKLLKDIMAGFFVNLIDYQNQANQNLENRVFSEVNDEAAQYDLFVTICPRPVYDPLDNFLHPVFSEDMAEQQYDMGEIIAGLQKNEAYKVFTIFFKCDYMILKKLLANRKTFQGELITDKNRYPIRLKLEQNRRYLEQIEHLYNVFQKNAIPWKTLNLPYANRFFNVIISECDTLPGSEETITEISFNLEEFEPYKTIDQVLLWNIERIKTSSSGFPMPAVDRINYEHAIPLRKYGTENGFLIDEEPLYLKYMIRSAEELIIVSPYEKVDEWHLIKICAPTAEITGAYPEEPLSNRRLNSFISNFAQKQTALVRTKSEIYRIINSFGVSKYFGLKNIVLCDHKGDTDITYD
ncbi:MAG TPA: normocyte-binding protein, partial [Bacillota bacterium]|nr:normocyte-binding protein [Bacillota bacterium]